jgi:hypothetical protein
MIGKHVATALCAGALLAGCAATQQARDVETSAAAAGSGFLGADYALLRPGEEDEALMIYRASNANWAAYDKIKLDPVTIWAGEESAFEDFSQPDRQALADTFYTVLHETLSQDYEMVNELGPGVLQVQTALTDAQTSNPVLDTISTVLPIGLAVAQTKNLLTGKPSFVGEASAEARVLDGQTGQLLAAAVDRRVGGKALGGRPLNSWDDARRAYQYWAEQLRYRLCVERGGADCVQPDA